MPMLDILIIADPIEQFKTYKDTTYAIMRALVAKSHQIWVCEQTQLFAQPRVQTVAKRLNLLPDEHNWYEYVEEETRSLASFDAVLMRKDPPFDTEYFYATHLLSQAQTQGAKVFNSGQALRDHPEKLAILEFPELAPTTLVTGDLPRIKAFIQAQTDVIVKPLDGMGGTGIFRVAAGDPNTNVILETLTDMGRQTIMVQRYLPAIVDGDKRVLLINDQVVPYCLARVPQAGETRGNLAAGGRGEARAISNSDRQIALAVASKLQGRGLFLVGLDIIGEHLTEINVTSPTCFQEIFQQTGFDVAAMYVEQLEALCAG